jgi:hypothetical protein
MKEMLWIDVEHFVAIPALIVYLYLVLYLLNCTANAYFPKRRGKKNAQSLSPWWQIFESHHRGRGGECEREQRGEDSTDEDTEGA